MPKYLDNSPLYSVVIEIRFTTQVPDDVVSGLLYSQIAASNTDVQSVSLPASQLPLAMRQQDPNLKYAPIQRFVLPDRTINVGSNVVSLEANNGIKKKTYPGWEVFSQQFADLLEKLTFVSQVERIGLRYVNFFHEEDFLSSLNVDLSTGWESKGLENNTTIVFSVAREQLKARVTIASDATIQDETGLKSGQIIDIDTFTDESIPLEDVATKINDAHSLSKEIFYSLPAGDLLKRMGPHD